MSRDPPSEMAEFKRTIAKQFATMEEIHKIVKSVTQPHDLRNTELSVLGHEIGRAFLESGICENNDNGWVVKKARDSIQSILNETLFAELNKVLGLPKDYYP